MLYAARCSDHWLYPDGSWMSTQWTRLGANRLNERHGQMVDTCVFFFGFCLPMGWKSPKKNTILGEYVLGHLFRPPKKQISAGDVWNMPWRSTVEPVEQNVVVFSIEPCLQESPFAETVQNQPLKFERGQDDDVYPCLSVCCWMMFSTVSLSDLVCFWSEWPAIQFWNREFKSLLTFGDKPFVLLGIIDYLVHKNAVYSKLLFYMILWLSELNYPYMGIIQNGGPPRSVEDTVPHDGPFHDFGWCPYRGGSGLMQT